MSTSNCYPYPDILSLESNLNQEQKLLQKTIRSYLDKNVQPLIQDAYRNERFPKEALEGLAGLGVLGANLEGYTLPGLDQISYGLIMKELERIDSGLRSFVSVQSSLVMYAIWKFGSEEQKNLWLPKLHQGKTIGCFGLTEASGGSDPSSMTTTAVLKDNHWIIKGTKTWITNGHIADIAIVWAKTPNEIRGFIVETNTKGFIANPLKGKLSLRASETSELVLDQVVVPENSILPQSQGITSALNCLTQARYGIVWGVIGASESCFSEVCHYVQDRILFKQPLAAKQLVQHKLATLLTNITKSQLLAYQLGSLKNKNQLSHIQVSLGKQSNCETALIVARTCRDILGANGIMDEYSSMRHLCNLETVVTYEGTNDIHLLALGKHITGHKAF